MIGIKTGGAIISDYISNALQIPNYKIKLTREKYKCNKKSSHVFDDIIHRSILNNHSNYTICEGIEDNLEGKNVILIDEMVYSGTTMIESIQYLKEKKCEYNISYLHYNIERKV